MGVEIGGSENGDETLHLPLVSTAGSLANVEAPPRSVGHVSLEAATALAAEERRLRRTATGGDSPFAARMRLREGATLRPVADPKVERHSGSTYQHEGLLSHLRGRDHNGEDTGPIRQQAAEDMQAAEERWPQPARVGHRERTERDGAPVSHATYVTSSHVDYLTHLKEQDDDTGELASIGSEASKAPATRGRRLARVALWTGCAVTAAAIAAEVAILIIHK